MDADDFKDLYQQTLKRFTPEQRLTPASLKKALLISESRAKRFLKQLQEKDLVVVLDKHGTCQLRISDRAK